MNKKVYYFKHSDITEYAPFSKQNFTTDLCNILEVENLNDYQVPADLSTNASIYNELYSLVLGRFHEHAIIKIVKNFNETPTEDEVKEAVINWYFKYLSLLNDTHAYYIILLSSYADARTHLMDDIRAESGNQVSFNDTPQNSNVSGDYEGDNYITHFTKTKGFNTSPLMSKIMRLKEIQDNYKDMMSRWVNDFERIFYQEDC